MQRKLLFFFYLIIFLYLHLYKIRLYVVKFFCFDRLMDKFSSDYFDSCVAIDFFNKKKIFNIYLNKKKEKSGFICGKKLLF